MTRTGLPEPDSAKGGGNLPKGEGGKKSKFWSPIPRFRGGYLPEIGGGIYLKFTSLLGKTRNK